MSVVLVLDTETTSPEPEKCALTELAWATVDVDSAKIIEIHSSLRYLTDTNPAAELTGIPENLSKEYGKNKLHMPVDIAVDAVIAHNVEFDKPVCRRFFPNPTYLMDIPWLCTLRDWKWLKISGSNKLGDLALAHGVGLTSAHRAFSDVLTLCALLARVHEMGFSLQDQIAFAKLPRSKYVSMVSYENRHIPKNAGFSWEPSKKVWWKKMTDEEAAAITFPIRKIEDPNVLSSIPLVLPPTLAKP